MSKEIFDCPFELVTIDLDGTLVDSVGDLHAAVSSMLHSMALRPAAIEDVRQWVGNGVERLVHRALTRCMDVDAEQVQFKSALELFQTAYQLVNGQQSRLYPDVLQGLDCVPKG